MARPVGLVFFVVAVALAGMCRGEIVKVTAAQTRIFDGKQYHHVGLQGERFIVYEAAKGWYLVPMKIGQGTNLVWLPVPDVEIDWGVTTATRVTKVHDANTIETDDGERVQFAGIVVPTSGPGASETHTWLKTLLEGEQVTLEFDPAIAQNQGGSKVAYVYVGGLFVNRELVKHGLAQVASTGVKARYDDVFAYFEKRARQKRIGLWASADSGEEATPGGNEAGSSATSEVNDRGTQHVRHLSRTQKAQWALNLGTDIKVITERTRTKLPPRVIGKDCEGDEIKERIKEICSTRTLSITVRNGWAVTLKGVVVKYEFFGKADKTLASVFLATTDEISGINLRPGQTRELTSEPCEFKGTESSEVGWKGDKYFGYRVTCYYHNTPVKVVASPEQLTDWKSSKGEEPKTATQ